MAVSQPIYAQNYANPTFEGVATAFQPLGKSSWVNASTASQNILLSVPSNQVQVFNNTAGVAYVGFGNAANVGAFVGAANTSTSDLPVGPGEVVIFTLPVPVARASCVLAAGSVAGQVLFTPGIGV